MPRGGLRSPDCYPKSAKRLRGRLVDMGVFSIRVSPVMGCATILSDADSVRGPIFCLRDRPTTFKAVILAFGILLTAAAIAACVTVVIEWMHAAYFPANTKLKAEFRSELARDSEGAHAAVAITAPAATAFLLENPFARGSGLLFLPEPVGSESLRQGQAFAFTPAERLSAGLVIGTLLPVRAPSDEHQIKAPLPRSRPFNHKDMQAKNDTADSTGVAITPKTLAAASPTAPSASSTFFEKFFHFWQARNDIKLPPEADAHTAVYDIEGHLVYLPNGKKLEAHSGFGKWLDDVRYVKEKGRGPTPPNVYRLALRESLFHGVQAIRLNPVNGGKMYGRAGMLAHPYMLGPDGQSNGCVSLQDYPKFLEAFLSGKIDRLIVVPKLGDTPSYAANALARDDKQYALQ
jgi:hypothetical protein